MVKNMVKNSGLNKSFQLPYTNIYPTQKTLKFGGINHNILRCYLCGLPLIRERYARDYNIYGCEGCGKTFYRDSCNGRWVELVIPYSDFFKGGDRDGRAG